MRVLKGAMFIPLVACATQITTGNAIQIAQAACVSSWGRGDPASFNMADWRVQSTGDEWRVWMDRAVDKRCFEVRIPKGGYDRDLPPNCLTCVAY